MYVNYVVTSLDKTLKIKWSKKKAMSAEDVKELLAQFGNIEHMLSKQAGSAVVEFYTIVDAVRFFQVISW